MGISILLVGSARSGMGNTLYFITQSMLSLLLLLIGSIMHSTLVSLIIFSILLVKLGVFPFWS
jgi:hypothetical protein